MISSVARRNLVDSRPLTAKHSAMRSVSWSAGNTAVQHTDETQSSHQDSRRRVHIKMNPASAASRRHFSSLDAPEYDTNAALRQLLTSLDAPEYKNGLGKAFLEQVHYDNNENPLDEYGMGLEDSWREGEFDPIRELRARNPLIFESNYDLEEYGPSFQEDKDEDETPR